MAVGDVSLAEVSWVLVVPYEWRGFAVVHARAWIFWADRRRANPSKVDRYEHLSRFKKISERTANR